MNKVDFKKFYDKTVKVLAEEFVNENQGFGFIDNMSGLYDEYMNQKAMLHLVYDKNSKLLDRHKICACMTVAIIKTHLIFSNLQIDDDYKLRDATCVNEQLAFLSSWELLKAFVIVNEEQKKINFDLPKTFHNTEFEETVARTLFMANQLNGLATPLVSNMYFLLERYCKDTEDKR